MKKLLLLLALLSTQAFAWEQRAPLPVQACQVHSPYGWATTARTAQPICRDAKGGMMMGLEQNLEQIRHGIEELSKKRAKDGIPSRGIDKNI